MVFNVWGIDQASFNSYYIVSVKHFRRNIRRLGVIYYNRSAFQVFRCYYRFRGVGGGYNKVGFFYRSNMA